MCLDCADQCMESEWQHVGNEAAVVMGVAGLAGGHRIESQEKEQDKPGGASVKLQL